MLTSLLLTAFVAFCYFPLLFIDRRNLGAFVVVAYILNDFIILQCIGDVEEGYAFLIRGWKELTVAFLLGKYYMGESRVEPTVKRLLSVTLALYAYGVLIAAVSGDGLSEIVSTSRKVLYPIMIPLLLYVNGCIDASSFVKIVRIIKIISVISVLYGVYTLYSYGGDYRNLWFYDFVSQKKAGYGTEERFIEYQFVRNGSLRVSGLFISSIEFCLFLSVSAVLSIAGTIRRDIQNAMMNILVCVVSLYGIFLTQTRVGALVVFLAASYYVLILTMKIKKPYFTIVLSIVIAFSSLVAIYAFPALSDASTYGRIIQYRSVLDEFKVLGYGMGRLENNGPTYKDSLYISVLNTFGVLSPLYYYVVVTMASKHFKMGEGLSRRGDFVAYNRFIYCLFLSNLVIYAYHYTMGGVPYFLLMILLMHTWSFRKDAKGDRKKDCSLKSGENTSVSI